MAKKLTYANVTSTLALFIALAGGVAYGANALVDDSKDIAAQSVVNSDVKKETLKSNRLKDGAAVAGPDVVPNSLGGSAINEADLAQVPSAASAATATNAANATDAAALGGLSSDEFARSSQIQMGGPVPGDGLTEVPLASFPNLGLEVRSDGDADIGAEVRLVNSNPTGGRQFLVVYGVDHQNAVLLAPGDSSQIPPGDAISGGILQISRTTAPGAVILLSCSFSVYDAHRPVSCLAIRGS
jgi:hypothetical protein